MLSKLSFLVGLLPFALGQKQWVADGKFPEAGNDTIAGGIFSISLPDLAMYLARNGGMATDAEAPKTAGAHGPGSGKYPAKMFTDPTLTKHTMYAPQTAPADLKMPLILWGNGACGTNGAGYKNFLTEIASHGYFVIADGAPSATDGKSSGLGLGGGGTPNAKSQSKYTDMRESISWAKAGKGAKYGNIDMSRIATAGHSCGGLEAMSHAYRDKLGIKLVMLFNIAIFQDNKRYLLQEVKVPVAWFVGGPKDMGFPNAKKDYERIGASVPAYHASLNTGHMGTFQAVNGGKFGKATVNYLEWHFRGSESAKKFMMGKGAGTIAADKWEVKFKNHDGTPKGMPAASTPPE